MHPKTSPDASSGSRTKSIARFQSAGGAALLLLMVGLPLFAPWAEAAPPSGWQVATLIETDNTGGASYPQVALDGSGNAVAVWQQSDGSRENVWANRYVAGWGWGAATLIEFDNSGGASSQQVAVDLSGNAVAVWIQSDGTRNNVWANRYAVGSGWGTAALIETDNAGNAYNPQVAVNGSGTAVAVWIQSDGARYNIWANRYVVGSGWGAATLIETDNADNAYSPQVAVDGGGDALAVWVQSTGIRYNVWSNRYAAGSGWGTATLIETDNAGDVFDPQVAGDPSGNAVAVWGQSDGTRKNVWSNRYAVGSGWGTATLIETDNAGDVANPQVAVDGGGDAVAVWIQSDGTRINILANRYAAGSGWGAGTLVETDNVDNAYSPQVAVDGSGSAVAVWVQSYGTRYNVWANRYTVGSAWGATALIETDNAGDVFDPQVAVDGSGTAVAVWVQSDGTRNNVWANRFVAHDATPPSLVLASPSEGAVTNRSAVWVAGTAEVGARVSVSGAAATVGEDGTFGLLVALQPGVNRLVATAWDAAGNSASASVNLTFDDPVPALQDELAAARADLSAAQSRVVALEAEATSSQSQLDSAHANLTAALARVSMLESSAGATQAALVASQAREAALEANMTAAKADLASAQSRLTTLEANGGSAQPGETSGQAGLAVLLAAVGIAVGAVGCALALRSRRPVVVEETVTTPATSPPPTPPRP